MFLFDFNTDYKYREVIGDTTIAENREDCSFIWENYYDEESCLNEYDVTIFVRDTEAETVSGKSAGQEPFRRFSETHVQRGYTIEQMRRLVERSGMELIRMLDAESLTEADEQSERVYVLARECQKDNPQ